MLSPSRSSLFWFNVCVCLTVRQWNGLSNVNRMRFFLLFLIRQLAFVGLQHSSYEKNMSSLGYVISFDERWNVASRPTGSRRQGLLRSTACAVFISFFLLQENSSKFASNSFNDYSISSRRPSLIKSYQESLHIHSFIQSFWKRLAINHPLS